MLLRSGRSLLRRFSGLCPIFGPLCTSLGYLPVHRLALVFASQTHLSSFSVSFSEYVFPCPVSTPSVSSFSLSLHFIPLVCQLFADTPGSEFRENSCERGAGSLRTRPQGSEAPLGAGGGTSAEQSAKVDHAGRTSAEQSVKVDHAGRTSAEQSAKAAPWARRRPPGAGRGAGPGRRAAARKKAPGGAKKAARRAKKRKKAAAARGWKTGFLYSAWGPGRILNDAKTTLLVNLLFRPKRAKLALRRGKPRRPKPRRPARPRNPPPPGGPRTTVTGPRFARRQRASRTPATRPSPPAREGSLGAHHDRTFPPGARREARKGKGKRKEEPRMARPPPTRPELRLTRAGRAPSRNAPSVAESPQNHEGGLYHDAGSQKNFCRRQCGPKRSPGCGCREEPSLSRPHRVGLRRPGLESIFIRGAFMLLEYRCRKRERRRFRNQEK